MAAYFYLGVVWSAISTFYSGLVFQERPYEPAKGAKMWASARPEGSPASHRLPLTLDEAIGATAVDARSAERLSMVLLEILAPGIREDELRDLAATAVYARTIRGTRDAELRDLAASSAHSRTFGGPRSLVAPGAMTRLAASSLNVSKLQMEAPSADSRKVSRTLCNMCKRACNMLAYFQNIVAMFKAVLSDWAYAFGVPHFRAAGRTLWRSVVVAAGYNFDHGAIGAVPDDPIVSASTAADHTRSEGGAIWRKELRACIIRSPEADTADLLRDVRAVTSAADTLVSVVIGALRSEDKLLRQVPPYIPVVVYSIASCLIACATYCSSPRYAATVAWSTPMYWRGSDADAEAIAEVDAALASLSRVQLASLSSIEGIRGMGNSSAASASGTRFKNVPEMQVNLHLPKGDTAISYVPRSARPALASLQAGEWFS